jgi:DDE superfamily endonuclease
VSNCCIKRGVEAIVTALYTQHKAIQWLKEAASLSDVCARFERDYKLPGCCGAIDGCVIPMKPTSKQAGGDSDCYWNYKGHPASLLLAVVDSDMCFTYINAGAPGNISDAGQYNRSNLKDRNATTIVN